jgi:hypothetical protein
MIGPRQGEVEMRRIDGRSLNAVDRTTYRRWVRNVLALYLAIGSLAVLAVVATREAPSADRVAAAAMPAVTLLQQTQAQAD